MHDAFPELGYERRPVSKKVLRLKQICLTGYSRIESADTGIWMQRYLGLLAAQSATHPSARRPSCLTCDSADCSRLRRYLIYKDTGPMLSSLCGTTDDTSSPTTFPSLPPSFDTSGTSSLLTLDQSNSSVITPSLSWSQPQSPLNIPHPSSNTRTRQWFLSTYKACWARSDLSRPLPNLSR